MFYPDKLFLYDLHDLGVVVWHCRNQRYEPRYWDYETRVKLSKLLGYQSEIGSVFTCIIDHSGATSYPRQLCSEVGVGDWTSMPCTVHESSYVNLFIIIKGLRSKRKWSQSLHKDIWRRQGPQLMEWNLTKTVATPGFFINEIEDYRVGGWLRGWHAFNGKIDMPFDFLYRHRGIPSIDEKVTSPVIDWPAICFIALFLLFAYSAFQLRISFNVVSDYPFVRGHNQINVTYASTNFEQLLVISSIFRSYFKYRG